MGIEWTESSDKWDIPHNDALHAMSKPVYTSTKVKVNSGSPSAPRRVFIGPQHDQTDRLIEVLIEIIAPGTIVIYHVMPLGSYYRHQMEEDQ
ncbi:hypothetical protein [Cryobacterium sp. TMS1-13-1]|uniref:hypothetical protein n=1 Tax=Cryobacterium sp. TMS1-13-1 TaxID=1259220 RepID=UPI0010696D1B|nr:hypothetical protein [Cryobacterium sp. TMS1-13-1]TFD22250.1 hypothetical protein E3T31_09265 [Cryobacterium sp. TMS1-13-1]